MTNVARTTPAANQYRPRIVPVNEELGEDGARRPNTRGLLRASWLGEPAGEQAFGSFLSRTRVS